MKIIFERFYWNLHSYYEWRSTFTKITWCLQ